MSYLKSLFSLKKITHKLLSPITFWDPKSTFTKLSEIRNFVKLYDSQIGNYTRINSNSHLLRTTVGNFCAIGKNSIIGLGRHPLNYASTHSIFYKKNTMRNDWFKTIEFEEGLRINIGNDVWIGVNNIIMDGVTIGDGAVIAAGAVVTKDIPPYAIAGGVPAKVIKYRFSEDVIAFLLELKWWNFTDEEIFKNIEFFRDPELTLEKLNSYFPDVAKKLNNSN
jgi:acetyltransferase-like isoleucine patch superfamily enzyme